MKQKLPKQQLANLKLAFGLDGVQCPVTPLEVLHFDGATPIAATIYPFLEDAHRVADLLGRALAPVLSERCGCALARVRVALKRLQAMGLVDDDYRMVRDFPRDRVPELTSCPFGTGRQLNACDRELRKMRYEARRDGTSVDPKIVADIKKRMQRLVRVRRIDRMGRRLGDNLVRIITRHYLEWFEDNIGRPYFKNHRTFRSDMRDTATALSNAGVDLSMWSQYVEFASTLRYTDRQKGHAGYWTLKSPKVVQMFASGLTTDWDELTRLMKDNGCKHTSIVVRRALEDIARKKKPRFDSMTPDLRHSVVRGLELHDRMSGLLVFSPDELKRTDDRLYRWYEHIRPDREEIEAAAAAEAADAVRSQ